MVWFKILKDNKIIDAGTVFLKWNVRRNKMHVCSVDEGQFVQSYRETAIYYDGWMKPHPDQATGYTEATVKSITKEEYDDIIELLRSDESIPVETIEYQPQPVIHEELVEAIEKPMTIAEMRDTIARQQQQIDLLLNKVQ